jgi:preprotein translocase subunit YajC
MMTSLVGFLAMAAPQGGSASPGGALGMFVPMAIIFGIFYFMLIRPQQRKEKERRQMIEAVKSGDRILFSGGILGTVTNVKDNVLMVKIAENVKIEVARGAVSQVVDKGDKVGKDEDSK